MPRTSIGKRKDKRRAILSSAEDLLIRFGAKKVSVEEICQTAGVSKMTFYKHFRDKADLVRHIHDELVDRSFAVFDEICARPIPFPEKIELMGQWKQEFMARLNVGFFKDLIDIEHSVEKAKRRYIRNIVDAQQAGEVRTDIDPEFLWLVLETLTGMFKSDSWRDFCPDLGEAQRQLRTILWQGLLVRVEPTTEPAREGGSKL